MESTKKPQPFRNLVDAFRDGRISRRHFIEATTALGLSAGMATFMANAAQVAAAGQPMRNGFAFYQGADGTPAPSPAAGGGASPPNTGMEGVTRGEGGELRLIQWQAPTMAATHSASGDKDYLVADIVMEPLMRYLPDGTIIPYLITEVPSVENGMLAEDLSTATFKLKEGILFSDGEPFTSRDVQFTWQWITTESNASVTFSTWDTIENVDTPDELTAVVTFKSPSANWFEPFTGGQYGTIYPAHAFDDDPTNKNDAFATSPVGTGPFKVDSLSPNDQVTLSMNENYWQPNAPYFSNVLIKGGGDAASAARAVLQTGEYEFAWNLQVEPAVLEEMTQGDARGQLVTVRGTSVERIHFNFTDPNKEVDGQKSEINTPHPFLTDKAVRQAMNKAVDRDRIANEFYGEGQPATANILTGLEIFESPNTSWEFNLDAANKLLDDAGWVMDGDTRKKDGVELKVTYATTVNQVRQKTQAVVKAGFEKIGIGVQLEQIDAGIYFDSAAGNEQNTGHFYWDLDMYTNNPASPVPVSYMLRWYAGPDNSNVAQKSNEWQGQNDQRYVNPDFDALYDELIKQTDAEAAYQILIEMNDVLINDVVVIPEVNRAADKYAISNNLRNENIAESTFEFNYWNIANWNRP
jgi:peptide/nickel transport system substrate-binding protein